MFELDHAVSLFLLCAGHAGSLFLLCAGHAVTLLPLELELTVTTFLLLPLLFELLQLTFQLSVSFGPQSGGLELGVGMLDHEFGLLGFINGRCQRGDTGNGTSSTWRRLRPLTIVLFFNDLDLAL